MLTKYPILVFILLQSHYMLIFDAAWQPVFVEVVIFEHFLLRWSSQNLFVNVYFFCVIPLSQVHVRIVKVLLLDIWNETWFYGFRFESCPIKIIKVFMVFDFHVAIHSQSFVSLAL